MTIEKVKEELNKLIPNNPDYSDKNIALTMAIKALEQPQQKMGHWIMTNDYYTGAYGCIDYVECSCCHEYSLEEGNYCPNCGAKMGVEE